MRHTFETGLGAGNVVFDAEGRPCRAWRPTTAPPPPPLHHFKPSAPLTTSSDRAPRGRTDGMVDSVLAPEARPSGSSTVVSAEDPTYRIECSDRPSLRDARARSHKSAGFLELHSETSAKPSALETRPNCQRSPPRGHLLPRGRDGIDGVLQRAREAENLYLKLQARRLRREEKASQALWTAELDQQREYKRMLRLAEYQEELVNVYGPSMKNIIADVFFHDGSDPTLSALPIAAASRSLPPDTRRDIRKSVASEGDVWESWKLATDSHEQRQPMLRGGGAQAPAVRLVGGRGGRGESPHALAMRDPHREGVTEQDGLTLGREREVLHRALDEHRRGRRTPF